MSARIVGLFFALALARPTRATPHAVMQPETLVVGEAIEIVLQLDDLWRPGDEPVIENFETIRADECWTGNDRKDRYCITGYARAAGAVVIHPFNYVDHSSVMHTTDEIRLTVQESPVDPAAIGASLARLRAAGLTDSLITSSAPAEAYVGQVVVVEYFAWGRSDGVHISGEAKWEAPKGVPTTWSLGWNKLVDQIDGQPVMKRQLGLFSFIPTEPGQLTIPSQSFAVEDRNRESSFWSHARSRRVAPPVTIAIKPSPDSAHLLGDVRIEAGPMRIVNHGLYGFEVKVVGKSARRGVAPPKFVSKPVVPVVVRPYGVFLEGTQARQSWSFIAHTDQPALLPAIAIESWNPAANRLTTVRCAAPELPKREKKAQLKELRQQGEAPAEPAGSAAVEWSMFSIAILWLLVLVRIVID